MSSVVKMFFPKSLQGPRERNCNIPPFFLFLYLDHSMVIQKAICEQLDEEGSADIVILYMVLLWEEICRYAIIQIYDIKILMERRTKVYYLCVNQKHGQT